MTVRRDIVEVICDGPTSESICPESLAQMDYGPAAALRGRMREDGWATSLPGGVDRCPGCRKVGAR